MIDDIRRENLDLLRRTAGSLRALAEKLERDESQVSQWIQGSKNSGTGKPRGMRSETARYIETKVGKEAGWLDIDHSLVPTLLAAGIPASTMQPILAWQHEDELPPGEFVMIPRLDVHLSAGHGRDQVEIAFVEKQPQAFRADWIRKRRLKPSKLASMTAVGDSMEDRIHDGDALVVDTSQKEVIDGKTYALWYEGGERVKVLFRLPGGGLRIHSRNPRYPDIVLSATEAQHVRIIGRVVHIAGEGGL